MMGNYNINNNNNNQNGKKQPNFINYVEIHRIHEEGIKIACCCLCH